MNTYALTRSGPRPSLTRPTAIDLFSGAGGLTLGLINAGFRILLCSDGSEACEATHVRNYPDTPFVRSPIEKLTGQDIQKVTGLRPGELDLLVGGPPCQGFSILGQRELWDPRNGLFHDFLRIAEFLKPKAVIIENVTGLATLAHGAVLAQIARAFTTAGYAVDCAELLAAQYGAAQMRWRMFFIGWRQDMDRRGGFPEPTHGRAGIGELVPNRTIAPEYMSGFVTIREAIGDLGAISAGECGTSYAGPPLSEYQRGMRTGAPDILANHYAARLSRQNMERILRLRPGDDWRSLPNSLLPAGMQRALRKDHTRRYRRMGWEGVARSIITRFRDPKSGEYIHPEQHRTISIREAARIQSFPDWFVFEGGYSEQYEQVGNAVPPLLARAVAAEVRAMLSARQSERRAAVKCRYRMPDNFLFPAAAE